MKKIVILSTLLLLLTGCGNIGKVEVLKELNNSIDSLKSFYVEGEMEVVNNEDVYKYDVEVSYKKDDYYRISLKNKVNNHEQLIIKNDSGVYVLTPSINKSFRFESNWPNTNSQCYLPQSILNDLNTDNELEFKEVEDGYVFTSKVNYPNNKNLVREEVYVDKDYSIKKVLVYDSDENVNITFIFNKFSKNDNFSDDYFEVKADTTETFNEIDHIDNAVFPMFLPDNTALESQDVISYDDGERLILTFSGDSPFILIEETVSKSDELEIIPTMGEPILLMDTIGSISDNSVSWISDGLEYYIASDVMSSDELLEVANSINTLPVMK